jgi:peptidoglycan/xylan/chitin deacetylase (PgdA/CDA1 family)
MLLGFGGKTLPVAAGEAIVSFTFDDFFHSAFAAGGAILKDYGVRGTFYAAASLRDAENEMGRFYTAEDLVRLVADGHELGCQSYSQIDCGRASGGDILADTSRNSGQIAGWLRGYQVSSFAYPNGRASMTARRVLGQRYVTCRGAKPGINGGNIELNHLLSNRIGGHEGAVDEMRDLILRNAEQRGWLIFHARDVSETPSEHGCRPKDLEAAVKAAVKSRSRVLPVRGALGLVAASA